MDGVKRRRVRPGWFRCKAKSGGGAEPNGLENDGTKHRRSLIHALPEVAAKGIQGANDCCPAETVLQQ